MQNKTSSRVTHLWEQFQRQQGLSDQQCEQFQKYAELLVYHNQHINLTAITRTAGIIRNHFVDSMMVRKIIDFSQVEAFADVGTGAGFPGLALKILFPHLRVLLIEVTKKKQRFLREVCDTLGLEDVEIFGNDWRTFLRTTEGEIPYFFSRASLSVAELSRMFKPSSAYNSAQLVYWASQQWEPEGKIHPGLESKAYHYKLGVKRRKLVSFTLPTVKPA